MIFMSTTSPAIANSPTRLIDKPQVLARVPWSDTTLWRRVKDGTFPAPLRISANRIAWREADVEAWIAAKVAA